MKSEDLLYKQVAQRIEELIETDVLQVGDKIPSVRKLSKEQGISMSTTFQAYYLLETKGLIEARPKSGYFVKFSPKTIPEIPFARIDTQAITEVSIDEMVAHVFKYSNTPGITPLSKAAPGLELLPTAKLNKAVVEAMRQSKGQFLNYEDPLGNEKLRDLIARKSFDWGGKVSPADIIVTNGCMEALCLSLKAITKPGDTVAVESPTYFGVLQAIESMGLKTLELHTHPHTGIILDDIETTINEHRPAVFLIMPNYNNPLGSCMPDENKKTLVDLLAKHNIPLIEDDIYGELHHGPYRPRNCKAYDKKGLVILCSSFSKTLAPGFRIGWVMPGKFHNKILRQKLMNSIATSSIGQIALASFLENGRYENHLKRLRLALQTQIARYSQAILEHFPEGTKITQPKGGFVLWVELPEGSTLKLFHRAIQKKISIAPGQIFSPQQRFENCLRISCGHPWNDEYDNAIKTLGKLIKESN